MNFVLRINFLKTFVAFSFLLIFIPFFVVAQKNYNTKSAYVIIHKNDTLHGLIKDHFDLGDEIYFKQNTSGEFTVYKAKDSISFVVENEKYYKSKSIPVGQGQAREIFLQCLVEGNLSLYKKGAVRYLEKNSEPLVEIENKDVVVSGEVFNSKRYIGVFRVLTQDCPSVQKNVDNLKFIDADLVKVAQQYNSCKDPHGQNAAFNKKKRVKVTKGLKAGFVVSDVKYVSESALAYNQNFKAHAGFTAGLWTNFSYSEKIALQCELLLTQKGASLNTKDNDYKISATYIQIPLSIYYFFPFENIKPFVCAGIVVGNAVYLDAYRQVFDSFNQRPYTIALDVDKDEYGVRIGLGTHLGVLKKSRTRIEYLFENTVMGRTSIENRIRSTTHNFVISFSI